MFAHFVFFGTLSPLCLKFLCQMALGSYVMAVVARDRLGVGSDHTSDHAHGDS